MAQLKVTKMKLDTVHPGDVTEINLGINDRAHGERTSN